MKPLAANRSVIGVFDSGTGGLVMLAELRRQLPAADLIYWADTARLPLGNLPPSRICDATVAGVSHLVAGSLRCGGPIGSGVPAPDPPETAVAGASLVVLACHTASAWALGRVRAVWPGLTVIGMIEAAVEAAHAATLTGRVALVGTQATVDAGAHVRLATTRGLTMVSRGSAALGAMLHDGSTRTAVRTEVRRLVQPLMLDQVDTLVLACTAYSHVQDLFSDAAGPGVRVVSPDRSLACNVASLAATGPPPTPAATPLGAGDGDEPRPGRVVIWHTGPDAGLTRAAHRLMPPPHAHGALTVQHVADPLGRPPWLGSGHAAGQFREVT